MNAFSPIAIVGLGLALPGATTPERFWENLAAGRSAVREVPEGRWPLPMVDLLSDTLTPDRAYGARGGYLDLLRCDASGLALDQDFINQLDPLHQVALYAGREAWRSARTDQLDRSRVGVVLAALALPTDGASALTAETLGADFEAELLGKDVQKTSTITTAQARAATVTALPASLIAAGLGLGGGTQTLDAACASSLYALRIACDELAAGRADAMLAGGVSRPDCLFTQMGFSQLRALSKAGRCAPFSASADGLLVGEGAGIFVLKRLDDALAAGDAIHGVIRGVGLANDVSGSLLAPANEGQLRAMRAAYEQAGWLPEVVDLIECHGTGTPVGDAVEVASLRTLWEESGAEPSVRCALGSVKSMIGHLLTAAGAAGLAKVLLAMKHGAIPPTLNFDAPNPKCEFEASPFRVPSATQAWERREETRPRRAAVSAFGFGGINAHLLVEEWLGEEAQTSRVQVAKPSSEAKPEPVAIVGMEVLTNEAQGLRAWQENLFGNDGGDKESDAMLDDLRVRLGRYRMPPNEIQEILPQQLWMLLAADGALADAGIESRELGPRAGVIVGMGLDPNTTNFHWRWLLRERAAAWNREQGLNLDDAELEAWIDALRNAAGPALNAPRVVGALGNIIANRIGREFGCGGVDFAVSAEEASGLRALEFAVRMLERGELDLTLAGAVDLAADPRLKLQSEALAGACGLALPSEGEAAVALVLKRLSDAEAAGDRIYGVVQGLGFASGALPGAAQDEPQANVHRMAIDRATQHAHAMDADASVSPALLIHGGWGAADDTAMLEAAADAWSTLERVALASAGVAGAASGLLGVAQAALSLYQRVLAPLTTVQSLGEAHRERFHLPRFAQHWLQDRGAGPRQAAVHVATRDGNVAHLLLSESQTTDERHASLEWREPAGAQGPALFAVAGEEFGEIIPALDALHAFIESSEAMQIEALARSWHMESKTDEPKLLALTIVAATREQLHERLARARQTVELYPEDAINGIDGVYYAPEPLGGEGEVAFVFPGSGNHYVGMGRQLWLRWPEVLRSLDSENDRLATQMMPEYYAPQLADWGEGWQANTRARLAADPTRLIYGQVAYSTAVSDLLRRLGVEPQAAIGYSLGESKSYFALRAWRGRDEMLARMLASPLFASELAGECSAAAQAWGLSEGESVDWHAAVVTRSAEAVRTALEGRERVYLLIVNTPNECVIGGERGAVAEVIAALGCESFPLEGVPTVHCEILDHVRDAYRELHLLETTPPEGLRFYSCSGATAHELTRESAADSILAQGLHGFDFPALIEQAYADGVRLFVEIGPRNSCSRMIDAILGERPHLAHSACVEGQNDVTTVLHLLAALRTHGVLKNFDALYGQPSLATALVMNQDESPSVAVPRVAPVGPPPPLPAARPIEPVHEREEMPQAPLPAPEHEEIETPAAARMQPEPAPATSMMAAAPDRAAVPGAESWAAMLAQTGEATAAAHSQFLAFSERAMAGMAAVLAQSGQPPEDGIDFAPLQSTIDQATAPTQPTTDAPAQPMALPASRPAPHPPAAQFPYEKCLAFAVGTLAEVLGPEFAEVDRYGVRVRFPADPLMLCHRIIEVEGEKASLSSGRCVTEHDVTPEAWYLDHGRTPACITIEAGQADLFLCSYLGIDLHAKGERAYRLLDADVTFHRHLPEPGDTLRYDIHIDRFVRQGETYLFFFRYEGTIDGQPMISMRNGCAGFFTPEEIEAGVGIVQTAEDLAPRPGRRAGDWRSLAPLAGPERYSDAQIEALRRGDLAGCFGASFATFNFAAPPTLPGGLMRLLDRVTELDPAGGQFGLGRVIAEYDVHPDDWFLTCHFIDDMTMPGTLMYECCEHTLRVFLWRLGWIGEQTGVAYEPLIDREAQLTCRGPVTVETKKVTYEIHIKELGYDATRGGEPYAIADAYMYSDGKKMVRFIDMSLRCSGMRRDAIEALWQTTPQMTAAAPLQSEPAGLLPASEAIIGEGIPTATPLPAPVFGVERIRAYCEGNPSDAFGEPYKPFDHERRIARLPRDPFRFIDRVVQIEGSRAWQLAAEGWIEVQFDVDPQAWFFAANRQPSMAFAILLEHGLQGCGWLAAYNGSALLSAKDMRFRNLGGTATLHAETFPDAGMLTTRLRTTNVSRAGDMIILAYDFQVWQRERLIYDGTTQFGFFSEEALAQQIGIRDARERRWLPSGAETAHARPIPLERVAPRTPDDPNRPAPALPLAMPSGCWLMLDQIDLWLPTGGPEGLGFIRGSKAVQPEEWFFQAHFYQDPVVPGSLGLESMLQLLKFVACERWGEALGTTHRFEPIALGVEHTWLYRGQVVPTNREVVTEARITRIEEGDRPLLVADGFLLVDGLPIYEMRDFALRLVPVS